MHILSQVLLYVVDHSHQYLIFGASLVRLMQCHKNCFTNIFVVLNHIYSI